MRRLGLRPPLWIFAQGMRASLRQQQGPFPSALQQEQGPSPSALRQQQCPTPTALRQSGGPSPSANGSGVTAQQPRNCMMKKLMQQQLVGPGQSPCVAPELSHQRPSSAGGPSRRPGRLMGPKIWAEEGSLSRRRPGQGGGPLLHRPPHPHCGHRPPAVAVAALSWPQAAAAVAACCMGCVSLPPTSLALIMQPVGGCAFQRISRPRSCT